jgi:hypothetical protein
MDNISVQEEWEKVKEQLEELFRKRDTKNAELAMTKGIELFLQFLFETNDCAPSQIEPNSLLPLEFKPINVVERLAFIQARPRLFPSFRQLCELMVEQEKLFVKKQIMKKASKPNG